ncbi:Aste57867_16355 [Aphanomyces stellatus]|uniref:Aste57867_16355 protein n=1 Tax=Aphanomyces stellatus TaxID=120398 RepID=A0A485L593_9STRA|nr:hypothetical protein As57867_016298 [Aphanomyces stellatus]VFT93131.1 Aste57867_16355 [Aphanomyces stellatus]
MGDIDLANPFGGNIDNVVAYFVSHAGEADEFLNETKMPPPSAMCLGLTLPTAASTSDFGYSQGSDGTKTETPLMSYSRRNSTDTTVSTGSNNGDGPDYGDLELDTEDEKRRKRLERNRISARDSRRRKKQFLEFLEEKVAQLTDEIDSSRADLLDSTDKTLTSLKTHFVSSVHGKIAAYAANSPLPPDVDDEVRNTVQMIQERYGPNSQERQAVLNYHFQQLDTLLLPPYTRFLLWLSVQDEAFFAKTTASNKKLAEAERKESATKKDDLWSSLAAELGMTHEQEEKIKTHYRDTNSSKEAKVERRRIAAAATYMAEFKKSLSEQSKAMQSHADTIQSILTPEQMIRYEQYVHQHRDSYSATMKAKGSPSLGSEPPLVLNANIGNILRKPDEDLSVDDISTLLDSLAKDTLSTGVLGG